MAKDTHKTRLISYLEQYGEITSLQAIQDLGNTRLSATIHTLRHVDNYQILSDMVEVPNRFGGITKVARYKARRDPMTNKILKSIF